MSEPVRQIPTMTQPKIDGYRKLTQEEAELINEVKAHGFEIEKLLNKLEAIPGVDVRWLAIGHTDIQQGLMAVVRAIARPTNF